MRSTERQIANNAGTFVFVLVMGYAGSVACAGELDDILARASADHHIPPPTPFYQPAPLSAFNAVNLDSIAGSLLRLSTCRSGASARVDDPARTYAALTYAASADPIANAVNLDSLASSLLRTRCPRACPVADPLFADPLSPRKER